jgi:glycogen debranching enzyme
MPIEIKVAPPGLTISQGRTFMVTNQRGEITPRSEEGVFAVDTRFLSYYHLHINNQHWDLVNSCQLTFYAARIHLVNPLVATESGDIPPHSIELTVERSVGEGIHEDFDIVNYSGSPVCFLMELALRSDFADIFEVKSKRFVQRGRMQTTWEEEDALLRTSYEHKDFYRGLTYRVYNTQCSVGFANGRICFDVELEPMQRWHACGDLSLEFGQHTKRPIYGRHHGVAPTTASAGAPPAPNPEPANDYDERQVRWQARCTDVETPNDHVYRMYRQAVEDMGALRIYDLDISDEAWVPAAGVPWFVTLFGRDSLIVSLQSMAVAPGFARGALYRLAQHQAKERDDWRDAQPGKILHELRFGELAHFHTIPFTPYFGTADATILYLLVLSEAYRWTGDVRLLHEYRAAADACLAWIDQYGDLDGDGFQEYKTYSTQGYENMGWKDSFDAVVYADGRQVKQPKALCELQGYVYDAKLRMAEIYTVLGDTACAQALNQQATELKERFNAAFWMEDEGCYAFGLDAEKQQINAVSSNAGHALWSGIADADKAARTASRLLRDDMWSGWGIRTLSSKNPAYNPFSYHLGSVWPHDNGMIAAGMKRYGLADQANQVIRGIFDATRRFEAYRPPEVFAGLRRKGMKTDFPAIYPGGANVPQAWASGAIFEMLRTMLGLRADVPNKRLYVNPTLPPWLPLIELRKLDIGPCEVGLRFWREGDRSCWELLNIASLDGTPHPGAIQVMDEPE